MKYEHTPEPWIVNEADNGGEVANIFSDNHEHDGAYVCAVWSDESATGNDGADEETPQYVTDAEAAANAERIVACVNGCAGIADPSAVGDMRDVLRALAVYLAAHRSNNTPPLDFLELVEIALDGAGAAALAKAEGR